jgi:mono/diheme cytochrome c family protein
MPSLDIPIRLHGRLRRPRGATPPGARTSSAALILLVALWPILTACEGPPDLGGEPAPAPIAGSPVDAGLAGAGEEWYRFRGCLACHTIGGGRALGPDLAGITERREYDWYRGMVVNPDSMLREDAIARGLLEEYRTPMPNTGTNDAQARAIFEYLRMRDRDR